MPTHYPDYGDLYKKALKETKTLLSKPTARMYWLENTLETTTSHFRCAETLQKFLAHEEPSKFRTHLIKLLDEQFPDEGWNTFSVDQNPIVFREYQLLLLKHKYDQGGSILKQYEEETNIDVDPERSGLTLMGDAHSGSSYSFSHVKLGQLSLQECENLTSPQVEQYFTFNVDVESVIQKS